ncbi:hypothetical protein [uncultured Maricaulis sp.]|uniref:hypothetical protein n=1 Tax=uncultured Maricaulis sp. TaxID=174710 RepID=UPI0025E79CAE|nr:hypothetical protein [uncultured Maricaulis sp.]
MRLAVLLSLPLALAACSNERPAAEADLFDRLSALCGQAFEGRVVSDDPRDADWASQVLTMHVRECSASEIRIPLHVGEDRSRTWVITREAAGLQLKHDHRHEDGSEDVLTQYGGMTITAPTETRAEFPADQFSRMLFDREGIAASMANVWSITLAETRFTYALDRPDRHFEAEFDLTVPVDAPPPPWGAE